MEIIRRKLRTLVYGEEGVALVVTLALFMVMFVCCAGVFAIGRAVKERILLQNAVDAAAYSAAVVQADTLSRIATINRAMAWTYQELVCCQMNLIAYSFLDKTHRDYMDDTAKADWICADTVAHTAFPNSLRNVTGEAEAICQESTLADMIVAKNAGELHANILKYMGQLNEMSEAIITLSEEMKFNVVSCAIKTLEANLPAHIGELSQYKIVFNAPDSADDTTNNWLIEMSVGKESENQFVHFADDSCARYTNEKYRDSRWFTLSPHEFEKRTYFSRKYVTLQSFWKYKRKFDGDIVKNDVDAKRDFKPHYPNAFDDIIARPLILAESYFPDKGAKGTISVVVAKYNRNPWEIGVKGIMDAKDGLLSAFSHTKANDWTFAIASAQAGYRYQDPEADKDKDKMPDYSLDGDKIGDLNLCTPDWDAVFVPVSKAFSEEGSFTKLITGGGWTPVTTETSNLSHDASTGLTTAYGKLESGDFNNQDLPSMHNNNGSEKVLDWGDDKFLDMMYH